MKRDKIVIVRCRVNGAILLLVGIFSLLSVDSIRAEQTRGSRMETTYLTGDDFSGWRGNTGEWEVVGDVFINPGDEKLLSGRQGTGVIVNGPVGKTSHLFSKAEFGDVKAHIEFMVPKGSNSGVYFMGRYEIQVFDSWGVKEPKHSDCGGIYQRWDDNRRPQGYEGYPPRVNASLQPSQWQTFDVVFRAPRFDSKGRKISKARFERVLHNGIEIHTDVELTGPTRASAYQDERPVGPLMLQGDHGPVAYRNICIEPAEANPFFAMDTGTKDAKHKKPEEQVEMLKKLRYDGIGYTGCKGLAEMLEELDKNGLRLFTVYLDVSIDAGRKQYDPKLEEAIKILKGRNTILWLCMKSRKHKPSSPEGDENAVEIIREIADMADKAGLRVALYPHYGYWLERVEDAVRLIEKVNRKNVGATFNLCHYLMADNEKNMESLIKSAAPYLFVVTINGADAESKDWEGLIQTLDKGNFDLKQFFDILDEAVYSGPIGLQGYGIEGDADENLRRSINAWRKVTEVQSVQ